MSYVSHLECAKCHKTYDQTEVNNLCICGAPLLVYYQLSLLEKSFKKENLRMRNSNLWRYKEFLPLDKDENIITLGEGFTPLLCVNKLGNKLGFNKLLVKDESLNPTGTFKARGAAVGVSKAKELGIKIVALPTAGNAGGAWSLYGAKASLNMIIAMPSNAPDINKKECLISGATLHLIDGLISDAGKFISNGVSNYGWYEASTLKEPYRIEGKKTIGIEIAEQLSWDLPEAIVYPTGGGVGLIGIWKALKELQSIGWIKKQLPKMISVQAAGCNPIVRAFNNKHKTSVYFHGAQTIADGICVPKALGDFLVLEAIYESHGTAISVTDDQIIEYMELVARTEGMFICPEGAAAVAGAHKLLEEGFLSSQEKVVIINTGSGLKYPHLIHSVK